jgi:spermidine synthase
MLGHGSLVATGEDMRILLIIWLAALSAEARAQVLFASHSRYNYVTVEDRGKYRVLSFNGSQESRVSRFNGLLGHFEYTEYLEMPLIWAPRAKRVLMIGLGGGSTQKAYNHYYPDIQVETVELDPMVVTAATKFFGVKKSAKLKIHVSDGRVYLKRNKDVKYDVILLDAYTSHRNGSFIPFHLATKEFFELASKNLTANGVLGYNVIGTTDGWRADNVGSLHRTLRTVFPNVYHFPARETRNIVFVATKEKAPLTTKSLGAKYAELLKARPKLSPHFLKRIQVIRNQVPKTAARSPVLTDSYTPASGLLGSRWK